MLIAHTNGVMALVNALSYTLRVKGTFVGVICTMGEYAYKVCEILQLSANCITLQFAIMFNQLLVCTVMQLTVN